MIADFLSSSGLLVACTLTISISTVALISLCVWFHKNNRLVFAQIFCYWSTMGFGFCSPRLHSEQQWLAVNKREYCVNCSLLYFQSHELFLQMTVGLSLGLIFLPDDTDYAKARCLSVCLSHASTESKRLHIIVFSPSGSPTILVFLHQTRWQYSNGDLPPP